MKKHLIIYKVGKKKYSIEINESCERKALQKFRNERPEAFILEIKSFYG